MKKLALLVVVLLSGMGQLMAANLSADTKTVLITGANRGIGFEFVRQYAERGWNVIATCRNPESAGDLQALAAEHGNVFVEKLDLLDHDGIDALAAAYKDQPVDILLNNAGLMRGPDLAQMVGSIDYEEFDRFFRINAAGPLKVTEAFSKNVKQSDMKIVAALTTGKGKRGIPIPGFSLYKTSKAALDAIQIEIALRWKRQGVKAVTLLPGRVLTHDEAPESSPRAVPVADSVAGMLAVLDELTMEQSGQIIQWDGVLIE